MGWIDALLFLLALVTWGAGAPVWVPLTFLVLAVLLLVLLCGGDIGDAIGDIISGLF